ncbi:MAG: GNAT family N-acetyltransferase, partial [Pyrinomonadaceae bacterium]|nr:GNAT family N-acetyltransferase [Pyrinomonadaceae bacterium]
VISDREQVADLLQNNVRLARAIVAFSDNKLLGIAGLHFDGKPFMDLQLEDFWNSYGYLKGSIKAAASEALFSRKPAPGELLMDGIVVLNVHRGKGIGSRLFGRILETATRMKFDQIRLDVIDENPRAQKLYETLGFKTVKHEKTGYLKDLIGVSGVSTMIKIL